MRQKYRKAVNVYNVVVNISGDVGQLFTGDIDTISAALERGFRQQFMGDAGAVAGRGIHNASLRKFRDKAG